MGWYLGSGKDGLNLTLDHSTVGYGSGTIMGFGSGAARRWKMELNSLGMMYLFLLGFLANMACFLFSTGIEYFLSNLEVVLVILSIQPRSFFNCFMEISVEIFWLAGLANGMGIDWSRVKVGDDCIDRGVSNGAPDKEQNSQVDSKRWYLLFW